MPRPWKIIGAAVCVAVSFAFGITSTGGYLDASESMQVTMHFVIPPKAPIIEVRPKNIAPPAVFAPIPSVVTPKAPDPTPAPSEVPIASPTPSDSTPSS